MKKVAIIGAGLSGLTLAQHIADIVEVTVFEKFHQVSGRMATRVHAPYTFDHGAQFFTVKHPEFAAFVHHLTQVGLVGSWDARFVEVDGTQVKKSRAWEETFPHYVGMPDMASVGQYLAAQLLQKNVAIRVNTQVTNIQKHEAKWRLMDASDNVLGNYDWVVTAIPAAQAANLMPSSYTHLSTLGSVVMLPCYALMLGFEQALNLTWDAAHVTNSTLSWISVNSSKPGRNMHSSLVAMSRNQWAADNFHQSESWVIESMMQTLAGIAGDQVMQSKVLQLKKWHYANAQKSALGHVLIDSGQQLASCGDWCISGRVESAFVSAIQLSQAIRSAL
ncbi:MAG: FAD-dependent oxidoreductase [Methylophilus sp.]|nr:FAD-dependent oxidoreductase [Methylophilus sp.]